MIVLVEPSVGFEPTTDRLQGGCSSPELRRLGARVTVLLRGHLSRLVPLTVHQVRDRVADLGQCGVAGREHSHEL